MTLKVTADNQYGRLFQRQLGFLFFVIIIISLFFLFHADRSAKQSRPEHADHCHQHFFLRLSCRQCETDGLLKCRNEPFRSTWRLVGSSGATAQQPARRELVARWAELSDNASTRRRAVATVRWLVKTWALTSAGRTSCHPDLPTVGRHHSIPYSVAPSGRQRDSPL